MDIDAITDPEAPDLFPAAFPQSGFPRYDWTEPPTGLPAAAWTTETTHRDGQQGGLPLTVEAGVRHLRPHVRVHRRQRRGAPGRVLRLPAGRPPDAGGGARAPPRRCPGGADDLDPRHPPRRRAGRAASACARPGCSPRRATTTPSTSSGPAAGARRRAPTWTPCAPCWTPACARACTWRTPRARRRSSCCRSPRRSSRRPAATVRSMRAEVPRLRHDGPRPAARHGGRAALGAALDPPAPRSSASRPRTWSSTPTTTPTSSWPTASPRSRRAAPSSTAPCSAPASAPGNAPLEAVLLHVIGMGLMRDPLPDFTALNEMAREL